MSTQPPTCDLCGDRVVAITGAGRGLGRAYAHEFARHGASVVVNDLGTGLDGHGASSGPAHDVVEEIRSFGGSAIADCNDISTWTGARGLIERTVEHYGRLDVLVNNAGILRDRTLVKMSEEDWDFVVRVHLRGTFATSRWAAVHWRDRSKRGERVDGRLINTSSSSGLFPNPGQSNYAAAKAGIAAMTLVAAKELARYGVTANVIYPSAYSRLTEPGLIRRGLVDADAGLVGGATRLDPMRVAPLVAWLGSVESQHVSGMVFGARGDRIVLADGWRAGPAITTTTGWEARLLGPMITALVQGTGTEAASPPETADARAQA